MPIPRERRRFYGKKHRAYRLELIRELGSACKQCGAEHPMVNAAHLDHDPKKKADTLLCPSCHATHDAGHRIAIMRRNKSKATGQSWLLPEIEYAPMAAWEIPGWIYDRLIQIPLFHEA